MQLPARSRQPRHDGADRDAGDIGDLFVGTFLQLAQRNDLAEFGRQLLDRGADSLAIERSVERGTALGLGGFAAVEFLIENNFAALRAALLERAEGSVAHDAEKPGPAVLAAETIEESEGAQAGVLHHVFGVVIVAHQKTRQAVGGIEMRQNLPMEIGRLVWFGQSFHTRPHRGVKSRTAVFSFLFPIAVLRRSREFFAAFSGKDHRSEGSTSAATKTSMSNYILHDHNEDGIDRRGFLKCMAWAGTGVLWTVSGGLLTSKLLSSAAQAAEPAGDFSFVQMSDSHIGFSKEANKDVIGTLQKAIAKINALPKAPEFILHTVT